MLHLYAMNEASTNNEKVLGEMQTLRAGCSKAEPKISALPQTPFPGAQDGQNLISWRWSKPSTTDSVWWGSMHTNSSYRGNRHTNNARPPQTGPITIHCTAKLNTQCNYNFLTYCYDYYFTFTYFFHRILQVMPSPISFPKKIFWRLPVQDFYRPDAHSVTQLTVNGVSSLLLLSIPPCPI